MIGAIKRFAQSTVSNDMGDRSRVYKYTVLNFFNM